MPRLPVRRKFETVISNNNNNNGEEDAPQPKMSRTGLCIPLPQRSSVVGNVLVCGQGDLGQLGLGDDDTKFERKRPALLESIQSAVEVCAGGVHNLVLTNTGQVYSFGCNDEGALGRETSEEGSEFLPKLVDLPGKALKMSAGDSHSACLLEDGRVFAWGSFRDSHGNMGLTMDGNKRLPIDVLPGCICVDIASGADHLVILTQIGKVFTVGCGEQGQLGRVSMRSASGEGRRGKTELLRPGEVITRTRKPIVEIWATNYCTFFREYKTDKIWACGLNNYMQLAANKTGDTLSTPTRTHFTDIKQIAGGQHHTLVLSKSGSVHVIGRRDYGRLGLGNVAEDLKELRLVQTLEDKKIVSISCGEAQSFALSAEGKLYAWGMGSSHQLGTGEEDDVLEPVHIVSKQTQNKRIVRASSGGQHSIFLVQDETQANDIVRNDAEKAKTSRTVATTNKNDTEMAKSEQAANDNTNAVPDLAMEETLEGNITAVEKAAADALVEATNTTKKGPKSKGTVAVNKKETKTKQETKSKR